MKLRLINAGHIVNVKDAYLVEVGIFSSALLELIPSRSPTTIIVGTDIDENLSCKCQSRFMLSGRLVLSFVPLINISFLGIQ